MRNGAIDIDKQIKSGVVNKKKKLILVDSKMVWRGIKYDPTYPMKLINYFDKPAYTIKKNRKTGEKEVVVTDYPTFSGFRSKHKIHPNTWADWLTKYPELQESVEIVKDMKRNNLITNGLRGNYNAQVVKLIAQDELGMSDKIETKNVSDITDTQRKRMVMEYLSEIKNGETLDVVEE